jgi:hypothetical protein
LNQPVKSLTADYIPSGSVSLKKPADLTAMVIWSIMLLVLSGLACQLVLRGAGGGLLSGTFNVTVKSLTSLLSLLGGIILVTAVMLIVHEGLHGIVFWIITREMPKFNFKWYYASACAEGWYLPRTPYMVATFLPLVVITITGLLLIPSSSSYIRYLLVLLIVFNASGCAGDVVVAIRCLRLPKGTLALDSGDEVRFFSPLT